MPAEPTASTLTCCEFFAGMGLMGLAVERAGGRVVWAGDFDPIKNALHRAMLALRSCAEAHPIDSRDIHELTPADVPAAALWSASFPCTDLSLAGRGRGIHAGQSAAVWKLLELLEQSPRPPRWVLFENVPALLTSHGGADFAALARALSRSGYSLDPLLVDAAWFAPQSRQRLLLLAKRLDDPQAPALIDPQALAPTRARPARLLRAMRALADVPWAVQPLPAPPSGPAPRLVEILLEPDAEDAQAPWWPAERVERFCAQLHPQHRARLAALQAARSAATAFRRVRTVQGAKRPVWEIRADDRAGCLRTPKGGSAVQVLVDCRAGALRLRRLAPIECARLQGLDALPEGFSATDLYFALGDAVCVPAIAWALEALLPRGEGAPRSPAPAATLVRPWRPRPRAAAPRSAPGRSP